MKSRSYQSTIIFLLALLISGSGVYLFANSQKSISKKRNPVGSIIHLTGAPLIRNEGEPFWRKLVLNERVYSGQKIKTSALETVTIKTNQGDLIRVSENSTITIQNRKNESPIKINIGNIDVFNVKNQKNLQEQFETIVQDSQKLQQKNQYLLISNGEKINLKKEELAIEKPLANTTETISDSKEREINLYWRGARGSRFEIQVSLNGKPAKTYVTKSLIQAISLKDEPLSGHVSWRVKDTTLAQSTQWNRFNYLINIPPIITQPSNGSRIYLTHETEEIFQITLNSPYRKHEIEIQSDKEVRVITINGNNTAISKTQLLINPELRHQPLVLRARSEFIQGKWTDWSNSVDLNLVNLSNLKNLAPKNTINRLICEKGQWECQSPLQFTVPFEKSALLSYSSRWYLTTSPNQSYLMPVIQKGKVMTTCAPFPHTQWRLKIIETNHQTFEQLDSNEIQVSAISSTPPQPMDDQAFLISDNEIAIEFSICPHTLMKTSFENANQSTETIITESGPIITKLNIKNPETAQTQFLDLTQKPISEVSEKFKLKIMNQMNIANVSNQNTEESQATTVKRPPNYTEWILKDASKIYANDSGGKAWTPIYWQSQPAWPKYEYQISTDSNFTKIIESNIQTHKSMKVMIPNNITVIYWRVRGIGELSQSDWSKVRKVEINRLSQPIDTKISEEQVK